MARRIQWYAHDENGSPGPALEFDHAAMPAKHFLRRRQAETGSIGSAGNQRVENRVLQFQWNAGSVILDLD
jgi:hypothetical protein